jgi:tetratricopeptide (TPR) repeat protein
MLGRTLRVIALTTVALPLGASLFAAGPAAADAASDAAFAEVLQDPSNLQKNLVYATALVNAGDVEGAIAVLERLILIYPDRAALHLSLGQLYRRVGSDAAAAQAFEAALKASETTPTIQAEAEQGRREALRKTAASQFGGSLFAGMQYQTNANAGPDRDSVWSQDTLVDRPGRDHPDDDVTGILGFNLNHRYDFGRQDAMALESRLSGFGQLYADNSRLDTARVAGQVGLGFNPFPADGGFFRLQPRVNFETAFTNGEFLEGGGGPGIGARFNFSDTLRVEVDYDAIYRDYDHVGAIGDTEDYTGFQQDGAVSVTWVPRAGTTLYGSLGGRAADTEKDHLDYAGLTSSIGVYQTYGSPVRFFPADWMVGFSATYEARWYDAPDDNLRSGVSRQDDIFQFDVSNTIPLSSSWSLTQQVQYLFVDSNLRNYSYDNVTAAMSARWKF